MVKLVIFPFLFFFENPLGYLMGQIPPPLEYASGPALFWSILNIYKMSIDQPDNDKTGQVHEVDILYGEESVLARRPQRI